MYEHGHTVRLVRKNGELALARGIDLQKCDLLLLAHYIKATKPESILEIGSGNGFNIIALAVLYPEVKKWCGVELTEAGVEKAQEMLKEPAHEDLLYVTGLSKDIIAKRLAETSITFMQGDARTLPWQSPSFDFVFSHLVIEQIPQEYEAVFKEAYRVAKKNACFIEGFREAQQNIFQRLYLKNMDYFSQSYRVLERAGFKIIGFERPAINKIEFSEGVAFCAKRS